MQSSIRTALCALALIGILNLPASAQKYSFRSFDPPGSVDTEPYGVNEQGLISGQWVDANGNGYGFVLNGSQFTILVPPGGNSVTCGGPTERGQVPVSYADSSGVNHSAIWQNSAYSYLPDLPGFSFWGPSFLNDAGHEVGLATNDLTLGTTSAYFYAKGVYTIFKQPGTGYFNATGINDENQIAGAYKDAAGAMHGYVMNGTDLSTFTTIDPPGSVNTFTYSINNSHVIAGRYRLIVNGQVGPRHGFLLHNGQYTTLDYPGALSTWVTYANEQGEVVGFYLGTDGNLHGFAATP